MTATRPTPPPAPAEADGGGPTTHAPTVPEGGERRVCQEDRYGATASETVVLTRESRADEGDGIGEVEFAGATKWASFSIQGVNRRWDWNLGKDMMVITPGGRGMYFNFRLADDEGRAKPSHLFDCVER